MNKRSIIVTALALVALPVFVWAGVAQAQQFTTTVSEGETVNSTLYSAGQSIDINGTVNGDIFCAGQNVTINATVTGDVICAAQNITIRGEIDGNIRVAGQTVNVDAEISRSMTVAAQTLTLSGDVSVGQDATILAQHATLRGSIERDVYAQSGRITVNGEVGRNVEATSPDVRVGDNAQIGGNLTYTSQEEAEIAGGAQIAGEVTRETPPRDEPDRRDFWGVALGTYLYFLAAALLFALLAALIFPQALRRTGRLAIDRFVWVLLTGFLASLVIPVAIFVLAVTFVGLPLALLLLLLWFVLIALSGPVTAYFAGRLILRGRLRNTILVTLIGTVIVVTLQFIPIIGFFAMLFTYWIGSGAILLALKRHTPRPVYRG